MKPVIIGSRGSPLALFQSRWCLGQLQARYPEGRFELKIITTTGDRKTSEWTKDVIEKGWFVKELEEALLSGEADLAVHSLKDMPTDQPDGLEIAAVCEREDPRDVFATAGEGWRQAKAGSVIGTSSLRRSTQLKALRPDLECREIRGNVDTRLAKMKKGDYQGVVLAHAGLKRLGLMEKGFEVFSPDEMIPAPGQGALGIEARRGDQRIREMIAFLNHEPTRLAVTAERSCLAGLGGGCRMPIGVYGEINGKNLKLRGVYGDESGKLSKASLEFPSTEGMSGGQKLAALLLKK